MAILGMLQEFGGMTPELATAASSGMRAVGKALGAGLTVVGAVSASA
jgi:hypothetical protein